MFAFVFVVACRVALVLLLRLTVTIYILSVKPLVLIRAQMLKQCLVTAVICNFRKIRNRTNLNGHTLSVCVITTAANSIEFCSSSSSTYFSISEFKFEFSNFISYEFEFDK